MLPQQQSYSHQGDNGPHTLRKDVAGIHTRSKPLIKNIRLTKAERGHSSIGTTVDKYF